MLSVVSPWLLLGSARLDEQATGAAPVEAARLEGYAASAITPLRSLQLCERLTLLPTCNRSPGAQSLRLQRGDTRYEMLNLKEVKLAALAPEVSRRVKRAPPVAMDG